MFPQHQKYIPGRILNSTWPRELHYKLVNKKLLTNYLVHVTFKEYWNVSFGFNSSIKAAHQLFAKEEDIVGAKAQF